MTYKTVYDAADQGVWAYSFPAFGLIFVFLGLTMVMKPSLLDRAMPGGLQGSARTAFRWVCLLFSIFWTVTSFSAIASQQKQAADALQGARFDVVEGVIENFVPMPYEGHKRESFDVAGRHFSYSDYIITPGF